jgi:anaerobic magnesium-protoporphyrin IX monomethyl ester cyclase
MKRAYSFEHTSGSALRIALVACPNEGEVVDRLTPKFYKNSSVKYMPLGLLSIAANLREYDVTIIDASSRGLTVEQTLEEVSKINPDILGLSVVTYRAWAMSEILRSSDVPIKVVGGPHSTHNFQYILDQGAHAVFTGDAEETFPGWIRDGCPPGCFIGQQTDPNKIPLPARELVKLDDYRIERSESLLFDAGNLRLPMYSSKGCSMRCNYCDVQQKQHIMKAPELIVEEFRSMAAIGATSIHILDDAFNIDKWRVENFCELIIESGLDMDWSARGLVETRENIIKALANAGCNRFHVGIEHLDDNVLTYFRKSHRYKQIERFCELCNKYGISILAYFILGAPGETSRYREQLPERIRQLGIEIPYFNVLTPLAATDFYSELLKNRTFKTDFWKNFSENPVKDFEIPSHRTQSAEEELQATLVSYINEFNIKNKLANKVKCKV